MEESEILGQDTYVTNIKTKIMSNLNNKAKLELEMIGAFDEDSNYNGGIGTAVMELIDVFSKQGHSGGSAPLVINLFEKLANHKPLQPLTGKDEEWGLLDYNDELKYQNKRDSRFFKDKDGRVTFVEAIIKRCPDGNTWTGPIYMTREDAINETNRFSNKLEVKEFPFTPKSFYIDVIEEEVKKDDWIMWIKDPSQLDEVWEHYKKPEFLN